MTRPTSTGAFSARARSLIELALWLLLVLGMWGYSYAFDRELSTYAWSPVGWPRGVLVIVLVAAVAAFAIDWRRAVFSPGGPNSTHGDTEDEEPMDTRARLMLAASMILPLVYLWLLPRAGYFATTPFFIALYMRILGVESWKLIIIVSTAAYLFLLLIFSKILFIPLPTGNWPGFYDFSNWLLVRLGN